MKIKVINTDRRMACTVNISQVNDDGEEVNSFSIILPPLKSVEYPSNHLVINRGNSISVIEISEAKKENKIEKEIKAELEDLINSSDEATEKNYHKTKKNSGGNK